MTEKQKILQELHEKFKAHEFSDQFFRMNFPGYDERLSICNPKADEEDDRILHITVSSYLPEKFDYFVLNNEHCFRPEQYRTVETRKGASSEEVLQAAEKWVIFDYLKKRTTPPLKWD